MAEEIERGDLEALAATRMELGKDFEPALLESFAERVEATLEKRLAAEVAGRRTDPRAAQQHATLQFVLGVISLVACIPIGITLGVNGELGALLITLAGIVGINLAHALIARPRGS